MPVRGPKHSGFASAREERLMRAVAYAFPKPVLVKERVWLKPANDLTKSGYLSCLQHAHGSTYKLTDEGRARSIIAGFLKSR
jgi:hypothetical protein